MLYVAVQLFVTIILTPTLNVIWRFLRILNINLYFYSILRNLRKQLKLAQLTMPIYTYHHIMNIILLFHPEISKYSKSIQKNIQQFRFNFWSLNGYVI